MGIDLPDQHNHLARNILPRIQVPLLRLSAAVTIVAVHPERVAELAHEGVRTVNMRLHRQQLQTDAGDLGWGRIPQRITPVVELAGRHCLRLHVTAMACRAIDFVVAIRENAGAAWKAGVDQPHHRDHLARDFLLGILVGGEIALHVTMRALHTKSLVEALHDEPDFGFRIQQFQILRRWQWSRPASAAAAFLSEQRTGQQKQNNDE